MKTLIVYASKHGSAKKCCKILSEKIKGEVTLVNILKETSPDLITFDNIIVGGSIYIGKVQKEISEFCSKHLSALLSKKVGLFICCMNNKEIENQFNNSFPQELLNKAVIKESFGGEFIFKDMNFFERTITKMISKTLSKKDTSIPKLDPKKDLSLILQENIDKFAQVMNNI